MVIKLFNTLSREKETFKPLKSGQVGMYHCGPTVYDTPHLGNYRTFVMGDLIRRVFEYNNYKVTQVMNLTDVDDKTIRRSREESIPLQTLTRKYEDLFLEGLKSLDILLPHHVIRATEHIEGMIKLVQTLIDKGVAYKAADGVYVSINKVKDYGALAHLKLSAETKERIVNDEYDKENPRDFSVWKFRSEDDGDVSWEAPFGAGRPGWHIECSAMSMEILGPTIDIHTGGADLMFPHHTNEIAQSESATGKRFVNYWMHGAFMDIVAEKMAKSKGNIIKLEDLVEHGITPLAYRYWLLTAHYRSPVNFTYEAVKAAQNGLNRLIGALGSYPDGGKAIPAYQERFLGLINDDLDMPQAVALVWELVKDGGCSDADKKATILDFDRVFGLRLGSAIKFEARDIPDDVKNLRDAREEARKNKDWKKADELRAQLELKGFDVKDTQHGTIIAGIIGPKS
ncbi:MAG: cysteine--tRNA ligase [Candidatus Paceibacterota bacterium]